VGRDEPDGFADKTVAAGATEQQQSVNSFLQKLAFFCVKRQVTGEQIKLVSQTGKVRVRLDANSPNACVLHAPEKDAITTANIENNTSPRVPAQPAQKRWARIEESHHFAQDLTNSSRSLPLTP
jgi:hypothetical protein